MNKSILLILFSVIQFQQSKTLSITIPNEKLKHNKRDAIYGDLSYSYSATDVGAGNGHIKTVTVIKNISKGKHHNSDDNKNIKLIVKWPEIPSDVFSTLDFFPSAPTSSKSPKIEIIEKLPETNKTEEIVVPAAADSVVETKTEQIKLQSDEKQQLMEKIPKEDVELLESSQPIGLNDAIQSAKAQATAQFLRTRIDNAVAMGDITKISEFTQKLRIPFIEDFSDFSMHTIRHLNNPKPQNELTVKIIHKKEPYIAPSLRTKIPK